MIKPRQAINNKLLVIYDQPQDPSWIKNEVCSKEGVMPLLRGLQKLGITFDDVSMICLSEDSDGKAQGYKDKAEYVKEFIET